MECPALRDSCSEVEYYGVHIFLVGMFPLKINSYLVGRGKFHSCILLMFNLVTLPVA
jgi:hypothetical protein